jgi:hypothetical protein
VCAEKGAGVDGEVRVRIERKELAVAAIVDSLWSNRTFNLIQRLEEGI